MNTPTSQLPAPEVPGAVGADFWGGLWRLADPKISLASMASMFLGTCAAAAAGPLHLGWLGLGLLGIFAIEVAKNASGEIFDFDSGVDLAVQPHERTPFSGGKRVLVDGFLTRAQTNAIAAAGYLIGSSAGVAIVIWREPAVLWLGFAGVFCAFFYQAPPVKLSYRGLGELAVAICYGPLICLGTYLVQRGDIALAPLLTSVPLGLLIGNFLFVNEFPDYAADRKSGKRTLVVRLGLRRAGAPFLGVFIVAFAFMFLLPMMGLPTATLLGAIAIVPAAIAATRVYQTPEDIARIIPAQAATLVAFCAYALATGVGLLVAP